MPRSGNLTRQRILDVAYKLFRQKGFVRVSMDEIAAATKVTKRTLYHHFESKDALLASVLETQHELALTAFRTFGDRMSGSPEAMIDAMFKDLAVWADRPRMSRVLITTPARVAWSASRFRKYELSPATDDGPGEKRGIPPDTRTSDFRPGSFFMLSMTNAAVPSVIYARKV